MTKTKKILYWLPTILWMAFIFFLSHQQTTGIGGTRTQRFLLFKTLHLAEYALLFLLSLFSFTRQTLSRNVPKKNLLSAFLLSWFYAFTDEFHQYLIPGRTARITDTLFDLAGIAIGGFFYFLVIFTKRKNSLSK